MPQRQGREMTAPPGAFFLEVKWTAADAGPEGDFFSKMMCEWWSPSEALPSTWRLKSSSPHRKRKEYAIT